MATRRRTTATAALQSVTRPGTAVVPKIDSDQLVQSVLGTEISLNIPPDATLQSVEQTLSLGIDAYKRLSDAAEKLKPIIGRILLVISNRKLWRKSEKRYKNFTEYLMDAVVIGMGYGRTTALEALRIARAFPSLTVSDYQRFGATRLLAASSVTDENDPKHRDVLESSLAVPATVFEASVKEAKVVSAASSTPADITVLSLRIPVAVKAQWDEVLRQSEVSGPQLFAACLACYIEHGNGNEPQKTPETSADVMSTLKESLARATH